MYLATAQSRVEKNVAANAAEIRDLMRRAAAVGADVIHFPECALSGYVKSQIIDWSDVSWALLEEELLSLQSLCKKLDIWLAIGSNHRNGDGERPFNSLYIINNLGKIVGRYDKRFCSNTEITDWYRAGDKPLDLEIGELKLGFALCIEINFPEVFLEYEKLGVDCVLFSQYAEDAIFGIQAQGHAACNNFFLSLSNCANTSGQITSMLIGPDGSIIAACEPEISGFTLGRIDPKSAEWGIPYNKARPWRRRAREGKIYS